MKHLKTYEQLSKLKVSFDFDFTLSEPHVQDIAKNHINNGDDVWIVTTRNKWESGDEYKNRDLYSIVNKLGITTEKIIFTNGDIKFRYLDGFDIHYDDSEHEIESIKDNLPTCRGILIEDINESIDYKTLESFIHDIEDIVSELEDDGFSVGVRLSTNPPRYSESLGKFSIHININNLHSLQKVRWSKIKDVVMRLSDFSEFNGFSNRFYTDGEKIDTERYPKWHDNYLNKTTYFEHQSNFRMVIDIR